MFDIFDDFISNPLRTVVKTVTQPIVDGFDVLEGLTEGEIREKAVLRLGVDIVAGLALSEVIELMKEQDDG